MGFGFIEILIALVLSSWFVVSTYSTVVKTNKILTERFMLWQDALADD